MANNIGTKNLYIVATLIFVGVFAYDLYVAFSALSNANETLATNKYAKKIENTKKLIKVFDQPLFESSFLNDFKSYGVWPLEATSRSRGSEIFTLPESEAQQLIDLKKGGNGEQTVTSPPIPVTK